MLAYWLYSTMHAVSGLVVAYLLTRAILVQERLRGTS